MPSAKTEAERGEAFEHPFAVLHGHGPVHAAVHEGDGRAPLPGVRQRRAASRDGDDVAREIAVLASRQRHDRALRKARQHRVFRAHAMRAL